MTIKTTETDLRETTLTERMLHTLNCSSERQG
jgi:hypothetical protein